MGLAGKPDGVNGAEVAQFYRDGRTREIADYCKSDVVNTYRVWLRYELFQGKLTDSAFEANRQPTGIDDCMNLGRQSTSRPADQLFSVTSDAGSVLV
jgi:hypothetical protein